MRTANDPMIVGATARMHGYGKSSTYSGLTAYLYATDGQAELRFARFSKLLVDRRDDSR